MSAVSHTSLPARFAYGFERESGFSHLELVVVVVLIGILLVVALSRLLPYIDEAERVAVKTLEATIRNALVLEAAKRIAGGRANTLVSLEGSNPMALMLETPDNYLGELSEPDLENVPGRHWYFDTGTRRLVYRPGSALGSHHGDELLELTVQVAFADRDGDGVFKPGTDQLFGVRLQRAAGAEWLLGASP